MSSQPQWFSTAVSKDFSKHSPSQSTTPAETSDLVPSFITFNSPTLHYTIESTDTPVLVHEPIQDPSIGQSNLPQPLPPSVQFFSTQAILTAHPELESNFPYLSSSLQNDIVIPTPSLASSATFNFESTTPPPSFQSSLIINNGIHSKRLLRHITFATSSPKLGPPSQPNNKNTPYVSPRCPNISIPESDFQSLISFNPSLTATFTKGTLQSNSHSSTQYDLQSQRDEKRVIEEQTLHNPSKVDDQDKFPLPPELKVFFKQIQPATLLNYREQYFFTDHINPKYSRVNCSVFYLIRRLYSKFQERKSAFEFYQRRYTHDRSNSFAMATSHSISTDIFPYENSSYNDPYFDSDDYFFRLFGIIQNFNERNELTWSQDDILHSIGELDYLRLDAILLCGGSLYLAPQIQSTAISDFATPSSIFYSANKHSLRESVQSDQYLSQFSVLALLRTIKILLLNHYTNHAEILCQIGLYYQYLIHTTRFVEDLTLSPQVLHYFITLFPHLINQPFSGYNNATILNLLTSSSWADNQAHLIQLIIQHGATPFSPNSETLIPNPIAELVKHPGNIHVIKFLTTHGYPVNRLTLPIHGQDSTESDHIAIYNSSLAYYQPFLASEFEKQNILPQLSKEEVIKTLSILLNKEDINDLTFDYRHIALDLNQPGSLIRSCETGKKILHHYATLQSSTLECLVDDFTAYMQHKYQGTGNNLSKFSEISITSASISYNLASPSSQTISSFPDRPNTAASTQDFPALQREPSVSISIAPISITKLEEPSFELQTTSSFSILPIESTNTASDQPTSELELSTVTHKPEPQTATANPTSVDEIVADNSISAASAAPTARRRLNPVAAMMAKGPTSPTSTTSPLPPPTPSHPNADLSTPPTPTPTPISQPNLPPHSPSTANLRPATAPALTGPIPEALPAIPVSPIRPNIFESIRTIFVYPQHQLFALEVLSTEFKFIPTALPLLAKTFPSLLVHQAMRNGFDDEAYYQAVLSAVKNVLHTFYFEYCTQVYQSEYYLHVLSLHNFQQRSVQTEIKNNQHCAISHDDILQQNQPHLPPPTTLADLFPIYLSPHKLQSLYSIHHTHRLSSQYSNHSTRTSPLIASIRSYNPHQLDALFLLHSSSLSQQRQLLFTFDVLDRLPHNPSPNIQTDFGVFGHNVPIHNAMLWDYFEISSPHTIQILQMMSVMIRYTSHDHIQYTPIFCREAISLAYLSHVQMKMHGGKAAPRSIPAEPLILALSFSQTPCSITHIEDRVDVTDPLNSKEFSLALVGYEATRLYRGYHLIHIIAQISSLDSIQFLPSLPPQPQAIATPITIPGCEGIPTEILTVQQIPGKLWNYIHTFYHTGRYLPNLTARPTSATGYTNWAQIINMNDSFKNSPLMFLVSGINNTNTIKNALEKGMANVTHINDQQTDVLLMTLPEYKGLFQFSLAPHLQQIKDWILGMTEGKTEIDFRLAIESKIPPPSTPVSVLRNPRDKNNGYFSAQTETYFRNWTKKPIISHLISAFNVLSPDIFQVLLMFRQHFKHVKHPYHKQIYPPSMVQFDDPDCFDNPHYWDSIFDKLNALIVQFQTLKTSSIRSAAAALHHDLFPFFLQADPHYFPQLLPKIYQFTTQYDYHMVELLILCGCDPNSVASTIAQYLPFSLPPIYYIFEYHGVIGTSKALAQPPIITAEDMASVRRFTTPALKHSSALSPTASTFSKSLDPPDVTPAYLQRVINSLFDDSIFRTLLVLLRYRAHSAFQCPLPTSPEHTHTHYTTLLLSAAKFYSKVLFAHSLTKYFQRTCFDRRLPFLSNFSTESNIAEQYSDTLMKLLRFVAASIDQKYITQRGCQMNMFSHALLDSPNLDLYQNMILSTFSTVISQNKSAQDSAGNTMLHYLTKHTGNTSIIQQFVSNLNLNTIQKNAKQRSPEDYAKHEYYLSLKGHAEYTKEAAKDWLEQMLTASPELNYNLLYPVPILRIAQGRLDNVNHPSLSPLGHLENMDLIAPWTSTNLCIGQTHLPEEYHPGLIIPFNQYKPFRQSNIFWQIFNAFESHPAQCILTLEQLIVFFQHSDILTNHPSSVQFSSLIETQELHHPNSIHSIALGFPHLSFTSDDSSSLLSQDVRLRPLVLAFIEIIKEYQQYHESIKKYNSALIIGELEKYIFPFGAWLGIANDHPLISFNSVTSKGHSNTRPSIRVHPSRIVKAIEELNLPLLEAYLILGFDPNTPLFTDSTGKLTFSLENSITDTHKIPLTAIFYHIHPLTNTTVSQVSLQHQFEFVRLLLRYGASAILSTQSTPEHISSISTSTYLTGVLNQHQMHQSYFYYLVDHYVSQYMQIINQKPSPPSAEPNTPRVLPTVSLNMLRTRFVQHFNLFASHYLFLYNLHNSRGDRLFSDDYPPPHTILTSFANSNIFHLLARLPDLDTTHAVVLTTINDFLDKLQVAMNTNPNSTPNAFGENFLSRFYYSQQDYTLNTPVHYLVQHSGNRRALSKIITWFESYSATAPTLPTTHFAYTLDPFKLSNALSLYPIDLTSFQYTLPILEHIGKSTTFPQLTPAMRTIQQWFTSQLGDLDLLQHLLPLDFDHPGQSQTPIEKLFQILFVPISTNSVGTNNLLALIFNDLGISNHHNKSFLLTSLIYLTSQARTGPTSFNTIESIDGNKFTLTKSTIEAAWLNIFSTALHVLKILPASFPFSSLFNFYLYYSNHTEALPYLFQQIEHRNLSKIILHLLLAMPSSQTAPIFPVQPTIKFPAAILRGDLYTPLTYFFSKPELCADSNFNTEQTWGFISSLISLHTNHIKFLQFPTATLLCNKVPSPLFQPITLSLPIIISTTLHYTLLHTTLHKQAIAVLDLLIKTYCLAQSNKALDCVALPSFPLSLFEIASASNTNVIFDQFNTQLLPLLASTANTDAATLLQSTVPATGNSLLHLAVQRQGNSKLVEHLVKNYPTLLKVLNDQQQPPNEIALQDYKTIFPPTLPPRAAKPPPPLAPHRPRTSTMSITLVRASSATYSDNEDSYGRESISYGRESISHFRESSSNLGIPNELSGNLDQPDIVSRPSLANRPTFLPPRSSTISPVNQPGSLPPAPDLTSSASASSRPSLPPPSLLPTRSSAPPPLDASPATAHRPAPGLPSRPAPTPTPTSPPISVATLPTGLTSSSDPHSPPAVLPPRPGRAAPLPPTHQPSPTPPQSTDPARRPPSFAAPVSTRAPPPAFAPPAFSPPPKPDAPLPPQ